MDELALKVVAALLSLAGLAGTIIPALPGAPLIFAAALLYGWLTGFAEVDAALLWWLGGLAAASQGADFLTGAVSVKLVGASRRAVFGAGIGTLAGLILMGPVGLLLGPFVGAFAGELLAGSSARRSGIAGIAAGVGALVGMVVRLAIAGVMIALFWARIF